MALATIAEAQGILPVTVPPLLNPGPLGFLPEDWEREEENAEKGRARRISISKGIATSAVRGGIVNEIVARRTGTWKMFEKEAAKVMARTRERTIIRDQKAKVDSREKDIRDTAAVARVIRRGGSRVKAHT